ncbi:MAG: helix-turn-helix domain-containing protein [Treponema sp.]|nr:helix-turn-helix domain-containing protein [Treponema sp.]
MAEWKLSKSIIRRKCHERQNRVSHKDYNTGPPYAGTGERGTKELSPKAKSRLKVFDWYYHNSALYSLSGRADASLACRHFGIQRSYFYRWKARYDKRRLSSLENKTTRPRNMRRPACPRELAGKAKQIRKDDPTYSAKKIRPILMRTESAVPSVSTIGRLISRENLFFRADAKRHKKRSKSAQKAHERQRKPYNLKADAPRQIIESGMKHAGLLGEKHYAFCAVDPAPKWRHQRSGGTRGILPFKP